VWWVTGDPRSLDEMRRVADKYICSVAFDEEDFDQSGVNVDRAFAYQSPDPSLPAVTLGPSHYTRGEGIHELIRILPEGDPRIEDLRDQLLGVAYFTAREGYFDRDGDGCRGFGAPRMGSDYPVLTAPLPESERLKVDVYNNLVFLQHGYEMSKDPWFLYAGRRIVGGMGAFNGPFDCDPVNPVGQGYAVYSSWAAHEFMWKDLRQQAFDVRFLNEGNGLQVTNTGPGSYTLRWTVPSGATRYQIKYGPQPMVENLNFDRYTRTYQYDPAIYDNFWAGNGEAVTNQPRNVRNEPAPAAPNTEQTYSISGLPTDQPQHFAMKIFIGSPSGTATPRPPSPPHLL
jgi:hypothetical protein